jgi:hypothetical protein
MLKRRKPIGRLILPVERYGWPVHKKETKRGKYLLKRKRKRAIIRSISQCLHKKGEHKKEWSNLVEPIFSG